MPSSYATHAHKDFIGASREAVEDPHLQTALQRLTLRLAEGQQGAFGGLDREALRERGRAIKDEALAHLDRYLAELEASVVRVGGRVHWASDGAEAREIVLRIAREHGVRRVVKSKSMTTEEVHLNGALEAAGMEVTETDFGEFLLQLAGERPSHLVAPVLHKTRERIRALLVEKLNREIPDDPAAMAAAARAVLRDRFREADMGITGVNFAVAETGTVVLVSNEGNARLTTTTPRVHVALMGIEKVIPRFEDLGVFLKLLARSATGQKMSVYTSLITGPRRPGEADGPEAFHLVALDNGRSRILSGPFRESLYCIRCGACLNTCPVYRKVGGHAYGGVYAGPIGAVLTPLYDGLPDYHHLPHASSLCGACQQACPLRIDIPHMLVALRGRLAEEGEVSLAERLIYRAWRAGLRSPGLYRLGTWAARRLLRLMGREGWIAEMPGPAAGWTRVRDFPMPAERGFRERLGELGL
ncbi:MAG: iron-sulfur cluster-binding protein [Candidatus Latescibacteria bacterium]|nr:iron-sulfur cluster-binding protein [Candidatus Latescibacterota bacterium]